MSSGWTSWGLILIFLKGWIWFYSELDQARLAELVGYTSKYRLSIYIWGIVRKYQFQIGSQPLGFAKQESCYRILLYCGKLGELILHGPLSVSITQDESRAPGEWVNVNLKLASICINLRLLCSEMNCIQNHTGVSPPASLN